MAVLVSDSFNRADSATTLGTTDSYNGGTAKTWVPLTGIWGISGNRAYVTSGSNQIAYVDAGAADVNLTININSATANYTSLALRIQDASNYILIQISGLSGTSSTVEIHKRIAGTYTKLAGSSQYVSSDSDIVKVTMQGTAITVYINDIQRVTATATEYQTLTKHGFLSGTAGRYDNLTIESLATGGTGTPGSVSYATKQSLYQSASAAYATKQVLTLTSSLLAATKQSIYQTGSIPYATQQNITDGGIPGSVRYATKQVILFTSSVPYATKQAIWRAGSSQWATMQRIMDFVQVIGRVELNGQQVINIGLTANRESQVVLEGGL